MTMTKDIWQAFEEILKDHGYPDMTPINACVDIERRRIIKMCEEVLESHIDTPEVFYVSWETLKAIVREKEIQ